MKCKSSTEEEQNKEAQTWVLIREAGIQKHNKSTQVGRKNKKMLQKGIIEKMQKAEKTIQEINRRMNIIGPDEWRNYHKHLARV